MDFLWCTIAQKSQIKKQTKPSEAQNPDINCDLVKLVGQIGGVSTLFCQFLSHSPKNELKNYQFNIFSDKTKTINFIYLVLLKSNTLPTF